MKTLILATRNRGKLEEIRLFLSGLVQNVACTADFEGFCETIEDGDTFEANAIKKAREAVAQTGLPALADDSGLVVDALDGRPGIYSARFAGERADDSSNNRKLLEELEKTPMEQRNAAFVCVMAFVTPDGKEEVFRGRISGRIINEARGLGGFGYDPLFLVDGMDCTMAELGLEEKNRISHRGQALANFRKHLRSLEKSLAE